MHQIFLCLNWAPVGAIVNYVVQPDQRAIAMALQVMISHLFGDAFSPFFIGYISDVIYDKYSPNVAWFSTGDSLEYSLYITVVVCFLGGIGFYICAGHLPTDRARVDAIMKSSRMNMGPVSD